MWEVKGKLPTCLGLEAYLAALALAALTVAASAAGVLAATSGSRTATAGSVTASLRSSWSVEIHVGFALLDGLDDCSLSAAAGYEIELGIGNEVLELGAWLPLNLYVGDVLSGELVGILAWLIRDLA